MTDRSRASHYAGAPPGLVAQHATDGRVGARDTQGRALLAFVALVALLLLDRSRLAGELRFFRAQSPYTAPGVAPVPQDDTETPAFDAALRAAAAMLPRQATCVIAVDAWQRAYFRASYLLMPHRVWPAVEQPTTAPPSTGQLTRALTRRGARCLLAPSGIAVPAGLRLASRGTMDLYLAAGPGSR